MSLAGELRKIASRLDTPGVAEARRLRVPLEMYHFFQRIKAEFPIHTVLDVGANTGQFSRWCARCFPEAAIHAFEPLPACQEELKKTAAKFPKIKLQPCALGPQSGQVEMFENDYKPSSSLLPMKDRHRELWPKTANAKKVSVRVEKLDDIAKRESFAKDTFLKLDVQGYELHVLAGAQEVLKQTAVVMTEVLFEPLYEGQAEFRSLLNYFAERGFRFTEFVEERRLSPHGKLIYADAAFVRETSRPRS